MAWEEGGGVVSVFNGRASDVTQSAKTYRIPTLKESGPYLEVVVGLVLAVVDVVVVVALFKVQEAATCRLVLA